MISRVISSIRVVDNGVHDDVTVFNRGASCGFLVVKSGDGKKIKALIDAINRHDDSALFDAVSAMVEHQ